MKSLSLGGIDNRLRWMFGVSSLMIMVLLASLALRQTGSYYTPVDGWGVDLFELAMGVLCLRRYFNPSWRSSSSTARAMPLVLGGACIVWGLGDTVLTFESLWGATPAVPSAADGFYLAFFPLCYIAFMMVIRRGKGASPFATSLDGLIAGLGAASISAAFIFAPVLRAAGGSNLSAATTMAYPVGDLLLLCLAVGGLAVLPRRYRRFFWVASVAMSSNATGDLFSLLEPNSKVGYIANAVAWPVSLLLLAMATWLLPVNAEKVGAERSGGFALPLLGSVGSMVILFLASVGHVGRVAVGLATATLLVAAVRLILTVRRAQALTSARFGSLIDNAWDIIVVAEADFVIAYITPSSERVLGYVPEDLRDRPLPDLVHPDDIESMTEHLNRLRNERIATVAFETRVRHREGEWRRIAWTATNRLDDPAVRGYVLNGGDVTEERHAAEDLVAARDGAMMASKAKSEFLSTMSHEIRTPMNGVIGLTELLLGTSLDPDQQELASGVKVSAENLLVIINGILDFSKIEAGQLDLEEAPLSVAGIADDVGRILAGAAHGKGVELLVDVHPDVPSALLGDSVRIQQVLLNLGSNAVKFTPEGEVVIRVLVLDENSDRVALRFEVVDEGIGIATTDQVRLFRPFAQADSSTTRRFGGTGLGLAICRQLVELMGGKLGLVSAPAEGSTFWFELSLARAASERSCGTAADTPSLASRSALIVDDNATNRTILRQQLRSWGVEAVEAADGYEAIGIATAAAQAGESFDVGVLDLNMPGMDGVELAKLLKADPATTTMTLFLLSSSGERLGAAESHLRGFAGSLTKPVRSSELFDCLINGLNDDVLPNPSITSRGDPAAEEQGTGTILLVEDNEMNQLVGSKVLAKLGYSFVIANNGLEAVTAMGTADYAAVLMDCEMPEMDGYEATAQIRRMEGSARHTPVIAMTAAAMDGDRERCLSSGMDDYITKPVRPDNVAEVLRRWILKPVPDEVVPASVTSAESADLSDPLDQSQIEVLRGLDGGDGAVLVEIISQYLAQTVEGRVELLRVVRQGDAHAVARAAHTLRGASANIGASALAAVCAEMETQGNVAQLDDAPELVERFDAEFARVRDALNLLTTTT